MFIQNYLLRVGYWAVSVAHGLQFTKFYCNFSSLAYCRGSITESRPGAEEGVDGEFGVPITDSLPPAPSSRMPPRIALASLWGQAANSH